MLARCSPTTTTNFSTATTRARCASSPSTSQPLHAFQREHVHDTIVFFGSARLREDGPLGRYYDEARELARRVHRVVASRCRPARGASSCARAAAAASWRRPTAAPPTPAAARSASTSACRTSSARTRTSRRELSFEFHYFFMRKLWFAHLARALRGVSRRLRHARRADRDPDARADAQARAQDRRSCSTARATGTRSSTSRRSSATA